MNNYLSIGKKFLATALIMLLLALTFGLLSAYNYLNPIFLKDYPGFVALRPLHVSSVVFWIILGATGCVYCGLSEFVKAEKNGVSKKIQWGLWLIAIAGVYYSYFNKQFGGREYWEFNPIWAIPIIIAWVIFIYNFIVIVKIISNWPVYIWMWLTGLIFFLFTFIENYLWLLPFFRGHVITDMTIQWKVNGALVGAWNQILYGTAFYLMDKIEKKANIGHSKLAFTLFFLGLFNLMFNWSHHIYTLPTEHYIRYVGYAVSMTEWIFLIRIISMWKKTVDEIPKNYSYYSYRFLLASEIWVFLNLGQAILMSIPAINLFTHGTHITVAHSMGTTIGINSMILMAACFEFFQIKNNDVTTKMKNFNVVFWTLQISLFVFWASLLASGVIKGIWQLSRNQASFGEMMNSLQPYFITFFISGLVLTLSISIIVVKLLRHYFSQSN